MAKKKTITEDIVTEQEIPGEDITPEDSIVPVYLVPLTEEEEAERAQRAQEQADREAAEKAKEEAKVSARAKLTALGLTEDEVAALIGGI
jgi:hypothetical protein